MVKDREIDGGERLGPGITVNHSLIKIMLHMPLKAYNNIILLY